MSSVTFGTTVSALYLSRSLVLTLLRMPSELGTFFLWSLA